MNRDYYQILGISKDATPKDLKKAYRSLSLKWHPDRNNSPEATSKFQEISHAYDVLSDPEKRRIYDQFGEEGLQGNPGMHNMDPEELFRTVFPDLFGGMGGMGGMGGFQGFNTGRRQSSDNNIKFELNVSLKELYKGVTKKIKISRKIDCQKCCGHGTKDKKDPEACPDCSGQGVKVGMKQIGPGMMQQFVDKCKRCQGKGKFILNSNKCSECSGSGEVEENEIIELEIVPGKEWGEHYIIRGKGNRKQGQPDGDLIILLKPKVYIPPTNDEIVFHREGDDLICDMTINLSEALTGFKRVIKHLDGRLLYINSDPEQIVTPQMIQYIENEGMPSPDNPQLKGRLIIQFSVEFPSKLSIKSQKELIKNLPQKQNKKINHSQDGEAMEEVKLTVYNRAHHPPPGVRRGNYRSQNCPPGRGFQGGFSHPGKGPNIHIGADNVGGCAQQ